MNQPSAFLQVWHQIMLIGIFVMIGAGFITFIIHNLIVSSISDYHKKYDYINDREIKNYKIAFVFFGIAIACFVNLYASTKLFEVEVWFFVRTFISIACATLVAYVAALILEYAYPTRVDRKLKKWRYMPRVNPKTSNTMRLLAEHEEDVHLAEGMRAEEDVFSIDYDVWIDEKTSDIHIEKYQGHLQATRCGSCGFYTMKVKKEEITKEATPNEPGELVKYYECSYCKSVRATAFKISTKDVEDYKKQDKLVFQTNKDVVLIKVEIKSATGGSKFYEFADLQQAQKFLNEVGTKW